MAKLYLGSTMITKVYLGSTAINVLGGIRVRHTASNTSTFSYDYWKKLNTLIIPSTTTNFPSCRYSGLQNIYFEGNCPSSYDTSAGYATCLSKLTVTVYTKSNNTTWTSTVKNKIGRASCRERV